MAIQGTTQRGPMSASGFEKMSEDGKPVASYLGEFLDERIRQAEEGQASNQTVEEIFNDVFQELDS